MKKHQFVIACGLALCLGLSGCGTEVEEPTTVSQTTAAVPETTPPYGQSSTVSEPAPDNTLMLVSTAEPLAEMVPEKRQDFDNGTYYYTDVTQDGSIRCISSCYVTNIREGETEEEYAIRRAQAMSDATTPGVTFQQAVDEDDELAEALGYPVYRVGYFTGSDQNAKCWMVFLTQTEHYSYQYAFSADLEMGMDMEETVLEYFATLRLEPKDA